MSDSHIASINPADFPEIPVDVLAATSNDALPLSREPEARHLLSTALENLSQLDIEIARLESVLASLKAQRPLDLTRIDLYRSVFAPQRKIPNELLSEIFKHGCAQEEVSIPFLPKAMPWVLGRVCSKWRLVARATPELWTDIHVKSLRTRGAPAPGSIRNLIAPHASRICALSLEGGSTYLAPLLSMPPGTFGSLEFFSVNMYDRRGGARMSKPITIADGATNLRKMTWHAQCFHPGLLHFTYRHLTDLKFSDHSAFHPNVALIILRCCTSLVECTLTIHDDHCGDKMSQTMGERLASDAAGARICVPKLELLAVSYMYGGPDKFLPHLDLPKLRHFEAYTSTSNMSWDPASTRPIMQSGYLEYLHIDFEVTSADLGHLFERAPNLVELSVGWGEPIPDDTLKLIGRGIVLPRLEILTCALFDDEETLAKHLDMIEERRAAAVTAVVMDFAAVDLDIVQYWQTSASAMRLFQRAKGLCDDRRRVRARYVDLKRMEW